MVADGMLTRKRYREVPPRVDYELTSRAKELLPVLAELARWGYEWAWSSPRASEHVDLGAIFRLAPGLVNPAGLHGTVELTVRGGKPDGEPAYYTLKAAEDTLTILEDAVDRADARVRGDADAWIAAFSPDGELDSLEITGDAALAKRLLAGLTPGAARHGRASAAA
jgi:HxlR-like helix-turn-helix